MLVQFNSSGGFITAKITVEGLVNWGFSFDRGPLGVITVKNVNGSSDTISIGDPGSLDGVLNTWRIFIVNVSNDDQTFRQITEYMQDGIVISSSIPEKGDVKAGTSIKDPIADFARLFSKKTIKKLRK